MTTATSTTTSSGSIHPDLLVGKKLKREHERSFREHVSAPTSAFAKAQLEKMGWSEGTGLGKKRNGITSHIKVKRRKEHLGVGGSEKPEIVAAMGDSEWWKDSLGATLAKLGDNKKKKKKDKKSSKKSSKKEKSKAVKTYTDEELFQATGGARFGMRAGITNNLHKWVRTETNNSNSPSPVDNASDDSDIAAKNTEEPKGKVATDSDKKVEEPSDDADEKAKRKRDKKEKKKKRKREEATQVDGSTNDPPSGEEDTALSKKERKKAKKARKEKKKKSKTKD
ncbi:PIN2/TERF1-interacting telomerase inhibitor 1 [Seminavis robusta]|uniref:PIN2/TERF1-interacting telomerase inhibitor 1 n=1 Tax=Seminavis robusta TaxID=568900 RepID=A0A9N8HGP7_9STRA|nr:PIN2/TERF1-interacting telomerase inhibitor 1 [Seminavis robusta]|eukprot:Sro650_g181440.1 PIN2/TERF1-interacting telomerase inhibitor 1 (281) ;mRNA; f:44855-45697